MNNNIGLCMQKQPSLLTDGFHDLRMAVACVRDTNAAGEIEQLFAVICINIGALSTF